MKIDIITIFPEAFESYFKQSIIKRAQEKDLVEINIINLRDFTTDKYQKVDDKPFGGGPGMVMMVEPLIKAVESIKKENSKVIITSAGGEFLKQSKSVELSKEEHLIVICGRYEGIDQRFIDEFADMEISIGKYVLTGGELPAMVIVDSVTRLIPGVVGNEESILDDSYFDDETINYPIYTRPQEYSHHGKILKVPDVLIKGNHSEINKWRDEHKKPSKK